MSRSLLALVALLALLAVSGCGDDDSDSGDRGSDATDTAAQTETSEQGETPAADTSTAGKCSKVKAPEPKPNGGQQPPQSDLDPSRTYEIDMETSCGDFTIRLDVDAAPETTASVASLTRNGFFDDTTFHRIVSAFVVQGGDPTGSGTGGPGYKTVDPPPTGARYPRGIVAMGKTPDEPRGTAGSQFFVVTGNNVPLRSDYAIIGKVVEGMETVLRIGKLADPNDTGVGKPLRPAILEKATLRTS